MESVSTHFGCPKFMSFMSIHVIDVISCCSAKFMSIHVIHVNSCHSSHVSFYLFGNSVKQGGGRGGQICLPRPSATAHCKKRHLRSVPFLKQFCLFTENSGKELNVKESSLKTSEEVFP
jgi:hypothetical protein